MRRRSSQLSMTIGSGPAAMAVARPVDRGTSTRWRRSSRLSSTARVSGSTRSPRRPTVSVGGPEPWWALPVWVTWTWSTSGCTWGWTGYAPAVWSTGVNPAAKLALLRHAFEDCGMRRVKLQTDTLNARSQAAIARLGAVKEGVLRQHTRRADGTWRDTVVFSILADEWPVVRAQLETRVAADSAAPGG